ncbi:MAG: hypothetical protein KAW52_04975 [candidate division Zixibacteria bacterium]|nr:hypothetical protein [candidate division Zixibacteria bacterium]
MGTWIVKINEHRGQYRITLPIKLLRAKKLIGVEIVTLTEGKAGQIIIEEYHGKDKSGE